MNDFDCDIFNLTSCSPFVILIKCVAWKGEKVKWPFEVDDRLLNFLTPSGESKVNIIYNLYYNKGYHHTIFSVNYYVLACNRHLFYRQFLKEFISYYTKFGYFSLNNNYVDLNHF